MPVRLRTLDSAIPSGERVRLIKFDVEGHEHQAILGARAIIEAHSLVVLFEQLSAEMAEGSSQVIELLRSWGCRRFAVVQQATRRLRSPPLVGAVHGAINKLPIAKSLLLGTTWTLKSQTHFEVADYPFIVAIPQWLGDRSPA